MTVGLRGGMGTAVAGAAGTGGQRRLDPAGLADLLGLRPPTGEQAAVIAAPLEPCVVIAGAGSGKTETMAARVSWLVANGLVAPDAVLGLTFTRKAAGELAQRVRLRLAQLRDRDVLPAARRAELVAGEPTVLTYHAYAARIVAEHALRVPVEPTVRLLSEAMTWQLAEQVVRGYDGDLPHVELTPPSVTEAVLALAGELAEHLREPAELRAWTQRLDAQIRALPRGKGQRGPYPAKLAAMLAKLAGRVELLPLVEQYLGRKRARDAMDFGDQMSLAARIADRFTEVGRLERARYRVVLLDEYQDTGHAQRVLLRALFGGGHPVTAVGDPCQSIYGWRGASAGNLTRFPADFPDRIGVVAGTYPLTTSFRNGADILAVANEVAEPLRAERIAVPRLRPAPGAPAGEVRVALHRTAADEADWVAGEIAARWFPPGSGGLAGSGGFAQPGAAEPSGLGGSGSSARPGGSGAPVEPGWARPTVAVLVRRRAQIARVEQALRSRGLPVEVVGLGGLLDTPEVADVVATLAVLADPTAGDAVIRLLTGARWRIGPRDLAALGRRAGALAAGRRAAPPERADAADSAPGVLQPDAVDDGSLVEALDSLGDPGRYSPAGYPRLTALATELRELRARAGQPLPDLVADVERTLGLAIEVAARPDRDAATARAHLDRFADVAADFADGAEVASLGAFLAYLAAASRREDGLEPGTVEVEPERVQVLTVHGAKGLEWDVVAVPGLTVNVFPAAARGGDWTKDLRALPYPLRGDAGDLPQLDLRGADDLPAADRLRGAYQDRVADLGLLEERRLCYVATTRARRVLLCSGYWWDDASRPRGPAEFLTELRDACLAGAGDVTGWAPPPAEGEPNPLLAEVVTGSWPVDPLHTRRDAVTAGAGLVRAALANLDTAPTPDPPAAGPPAARPPAGRRRRRAAGPVDQQELFDPVVPDARTWAVEAELLLAERDRAQQAAAGAVDVPLPAHLSVTALVALRRDPAELARQIRRPMPYRPAPLTRRGTAFHAWLEERFGGERLLDLDELPGAADSGAAPDEDLELLQDRFLASEWAHRRPAEVEVPFETTIGGAGRPLVVRGRIDAVFADDGGGWTVVDWKTGAEPTGADRRAAEVQLAAYRLAWAALAGAPVERVRAAFHYVRTNRTVRPADLLDAAQLRGLVEAVPQVER
jgi:DNA helicase-2/ATP-dependent DNA helicase PcrA